MQLAPLLLNSSLTRICRSPPAVSPHRQQCQLSCASTSTNMAVRDPLHYRCCTTAHTTDARPKRNPWAPRSQNTDTDTNSLKHPTQATSPTRPPSDLQQPSCCVTSSTSAPCSIAAQARQISCAGATSSSACPLADLVVTKAQGCVQLIPHATPQRGTFWVAHFS